LPNKENTNYGHKEALTNTRRQLITIRQSRKMAPLTDDRVCHGSTSIVVTAIKGHSADSLQSLWALIIATQKLNIIVTDKEGTRPHWKTQRMLPWMEATS
jgi:hypothetical protein